jgi:osmotically-inducible protein OsmY
MAAAAVTPTRDDESIRNDVLSELEWDPKIDSSGIGVAVKDGVVTPWSEKSEAERVAWSTPGITQVENYITVTP